MQTIKKLLYLLSSKERKSAFFLLLMIFLMALLDMIGVASILPFMAVVTNPGLIETNIFLKNLFNYLNIFGVENNQHFIFTLGIMVFILLIVSLVFKAFTTYVQTRFVMMREYTISKRLVEGYLQQPYSWFLDRHSADLGKNILSEVAGVVANCVKPLIELIAKGMITISLITLLLIANPKLAIIVGVSLGAAYSLIFYFIRNFLNRIGDERLKNNQLRFATISEAFGAAKEVKVAGLEQTYIKRFSDSAKVFAKNQASAAVLGQLPRFALEAIAFGGIMLVILFFIRQTGNLNNALPLISLYVFAGYRLMPALQQVYVSFTKLTFFSSGLDNVYNDLRNLKSFNSDQKEDFLFLNKSIELKNIFYSYPNASRATLQDISLTIPAKTTVGLAGVTGSGKTTTVDIILGLLEVESGTLEIDGQVISKKNSRTWQRSIGYVPQNIYLSDDKVARNIAFGEDSGKIDQKAVEKASKIANLHKFVMDELPNQYYTTIGERGVKLSGGQRQRIGIARALYKNPQVLILDEATSALDNLTERAVMDAVNNLHKNITIILIAHRLSTVKKCDKIFLLDKGKIKNSGTFEQLVKVDENFSMNVNN
jgi:ABC-type multidrug transport system fused ATPase/permease subunit